MIAPTSGNLYRQVNTLDIWIAFSTDVTNTLVSGDTQIGNNLEDSDNIGTALGADLIAFDPTGWTQVANDFSLTIVTGVETALAPNSIDLSGTTPTARYIDIETINEQNDFGLSEVMVFGAIPEPSTYALLLGVIALATATRRRR